MKYYKHLYLSEGLEKKKDKIIQKIEAGKILPGIFLVTLAPDEKINWKYIAIFAFTAGFSQRGALCGGNFQRL